MKKYSFTGETSHYNGTTLHRIKEEISFNDVEVGDLGGWIEKEDNLSHEGYAWVKDNAKVYGKAMVSAVMRKIVRGTVCLT